MRSLVHALRRALPTLLAAIFVMVPMLLGCFAATNEPQLVQQSPVITNFVIVVTNVVVTNVVATNMVVTVTNAVLTNSLALTRPSDKKSSPC
jgi:hypothetical protein